MSNGPAIGTGLFDFLFTAHSSQVLGCLIGSGFDIRYAIYDGTLHKGAGGTFTTTDGKTVTVKGGIITSIV